MLLWLFGDLISWTNSPFNWISVYVTAINKNVRKFLLENPCTVESLWTSSNTSSLSDRAFSGLFVKNDGGGKTHETMLNYTVYSTLQILPKLSVKTQKKLKCHVLACDCVKCFIASLPCRKNDLGSRPHSWHSSKLTEEESEPTVREAPPAPVWQPKHEARWAF